MPSPIGPWNLQGDFLDGTLSIDTIDPTGNLTQVTLDGENLLGFWDEDAQKLTFLRTNSPPNAPATPEFLARLIVFTGYLISNEAGALAFAGSYQSLQGSGATAHRSVFGWYALPQ